MQPDLKKKLEDVARKAKATIYPDMEALRRKWKIEKDREKANQNRKR